VALLMFPFATGFWHLLLLNILVGISYGSRFPAHAGVAIENAPGYGMGAVMSVALHGAWFWHDDRPMLFGFIASHANLGAPFWGGGLMCATLTAIGHPLINRKAVVRRF